ncbi:cell division topological specificity factor MinE [bacterium]|nr:cell division topological specificity factor MinE [bacterium]
MIDAIKRLFTHEGGSKEIAKERLKLVLIHDRTSISTEIIDQIKEEMIQVISKHLEIDRDGVEFSLEGEENSVALVANIPIKGVRRHKKKN